jgi:hypothetical protein
MGISANMPSLSVSKMLLIPSFSPPQNPNVTPPGFNLNENVEYRGTFTIAVGSSILFLLLLAVISATIVLAVTAVTIKKKRVAKSVHKMKKNIAYESTGSRITTKHNSAYEHTVI